MARFSGAEWIGPTPNETPGGQIDVHGLVLHIQEGSEAGSEAWFRNPDAQASAHFLNPKSGGLRQLVDTDDRAWAEMAGNRHWLSVENEGFSGESLTDSQIENVAQLFAWIHQTYSTPIQSTDDPNGAGLGWHGMGGDAWGGHFDCPGDPIKAQRPHILSRVNEILGVGTTPVPQPAPYPPGVLHQQVTVDGLTYGYGATGDQVSQVQRLLLAQGCDPQGIDGVWGDHTGAAYAQWQTKCGFTGSDANGVPGSTSMRKLLWSSGQVPGFSHNLAWNGTYGNSPDDSARTWQQKMSDRGWAINGVDGWYGPHSQEICREFQQRHGLQVDGIVGPVTWLMTWMAP